MVGVEGVILAELFEVALDLGLELIKSNFGEVRLEFNRGGGLEDCETDRGILPVVVVGTGRALP